ncbi:MAG: winged helix-turn-helix transcriptional regulator, partial [Chloroflexi bacterium]|nr:winged helix-turn-helix transcriptional regulator [Chloroflexota bacterium]
MALQSLTMTLHKDTHSPLYLQVYTQIREQILHGQLQSEEQLPPSRHLARALGVARITITQAYELLTAEGFVQSRQGAGTFVTANLLPLSDHTAVYQPTLSSWGQRVMETAPKGGRTAVKPEIDFGFGRSFPHIFPYDIWRRLLARYLSTDDVMLSRYGSV